MTFSQRVNELKAESAYQVLARAKALEMQGHHIIHLEIGEPDFETPVNIRKAAIAAIEDGRTKYTSPVGINELREAIAEYASQRRGNMSINPSQIVVGPGAKPALFFPTLALVDPGDEVIYPDPGFPTYAAMIEVAGGIPVPVPLSEESGFSFDLDAFDRLVNDKTKLILINTPGSNPTGGIIPLGDLEHIATAAQHYNCWVLSDEIYERIIYDGIKVHSIASLPGMADRTVIADGFSKSHAMTGWRLGYGIMPQALAERVELLQTHSVGSTAEFTQYAGIEALKGPQSDTESMVAAYKKRRDGMVAGLNKIPGIHCLKPKAAFYAFPNIKAFEKTSAELANILLEQAHVALLPGSAFGRHGEGYLRLAYANSLENIEFALQRIAEALSNLS
jgi:aspartate/methionine/tyrosine aminotransferase